MVRTFLVLSMLLATGTGIVLNSLKDLNSFNIELSQDVETECENEVSFSNSEVDLFSNLEVLKFTDLYSKIELDQCIAGLLINPVHKDVLTPPPEFC